SARHAVFKGLALGKVARTPHLYAADFHNNRIAVFDSKFHAVSLGGDFTDPKLPAGYAPFNIANIGGDLFVAYAKQDSKRQDEVAGAGLGIVDMYRTNGTFVRRVASRGALNAPWAMTRARADFGPFGGDILIGNFGD